MVTAPLASFFIKKNLFFYNPLPLLCFWADTGEMKGKESLRRIGELNSEAAERRITVGG